ncbi:MAG: hypothetical protein WC897_02530 [Candidatus Gracilibacteria bacterium]
MKADKTSLLQSEKFTIYDITQNVDSAWRIDLLRRMSTNPEGYKGLTLTPANDLCVEQDGCSQLEEIRAFIHTHIAREIEMGRDPGQTAQDVLKKKLKGMEELIGNEDVLTYVRRRMEAFLSTREKLEGLSGKLLEEVLGVQVSATIQTADLEGLIFTFRRGHMRKASAPDALGVYPSYAKPILTNNLNDAIGLLDDPACNFLAGINLNTTGGMELLEGHDLQQYEKRSALLDCLKEFIASIN